MYAIRSYYDLEKVYDFARRRHVPLCTHLAESVDEVRITSYNVCYTKLLRVASQDDMLGVPCSGLLRTGLAGSESHRAGLLVAGEALGSTLPFTGEGVGKALVV